MGDFIVNDNIIAEKEAQEAANRPSKRSRKEVLKEKILAARVTAHKGAVKVSRASSDFKRSFGGYAGSPQKAGSAVIRQTTGQLREEPSWMRHADQDVFEPQSRGGLFDHPKSSALFERRTKR